MPEYLKSLTIILILGGCAFGVARKSLGTFVATDGKAFSEAFVRRRNLWFAITAIAFLAHDFWIYLLVAGIVLFAAARREPNPLALYFFVLFAVPPLAGMIPGMGVINYLLELDYFRLLALTVLLPAYLALRQRKERLPFGRLASDKFLAAYLLLLFVLQLRSDTFTNTLRHGVYSLLDVFLPYYVASRAIRTMHAFRDVVAAFVMAGSVLALIAVFEFAKRWLLYAPLAPMLETSSVWNWSHYLSRGSNLRALASTGHPIVLGYVMVVASSLYLFIAQARATASAQPYDAAAGRHASRGGEPGAVGSLAYGLSHLARGLVLLLSKAQTARYAWHLGLLLLAGLVVPLSRGPWIGALAALTIFVASGPRPLLTFARAGAFALLGMMLLLLTRLREPVLAYMPFVGTVDSETIAYRQQLFDVSIAVIGKHPWVGNPDFLMDHAMQQMMQGEHIIDIVNCYLSVALSSGLIGLGLFGGFFAIIVSGVRGAMVSQPDDSDVRMLGRALLAALGGVLVTLATCSTVLSVPLIYWCVAGLGAAYARLPHRLRAGQTAPRAARLSAVQRLGWAAMAGGRPRATEDAA